MSFDGHIEKTTKKVAGAGSKILWCKLCKKDVHYEQGLYGVNQHVSSKTHQRLWEELKPNKQTTLQPVAGSWKLSKPLHVAVTEAEILWLFKVAEEDWSFSSCDQLDKLFSRMFQGSTTAEKFGVGHTKASYSVRHALGPIVRELLVKDINDSGNLFTLMLDETTTKQVVKQMDFLVRYWSNTEECVVTRYLDSKFFAHAKAPDLCDKSFDVLQSNGLEIKLLLNLSTDGPNINKSLWVKVHEQLLSYGLQGLLPLVTCCLHLIHNAFHYGCVEYGSEVESLSLHLHGWFKIAPCKREDIAAISDELGESNPMFVRHVTSRWLTLVPALEKMEIHWNAAKKYFLEYLPSMKTEFKNYTSKNERYQKIVEKLKISQRMLVQMAFVIDVSKPYYKFLLRFQGEGPLIHIMFSELKKVLLAVMRRFMKSEELNGKSAKSLLKMDPKKEEFHLPLEKIEVGAKTERLLQKLSPFEQKKEREKMPKFYIASTKQMQRRLPLQDPLVFNAACLHPGCRTQAISLNHIEKLAKMVPHIIQETEVRQVKDEWRLYMVESEKKLPDALQCERVDHYWNQVFKIKTTSGHLKYIILPKLVKAILAFQNGNANVERSLSDNKNTVTTERTELMEQTIVALRLMKEYARKCGGAENVCITEEMVKRMKEAKRLNDIRLKEEAEKAKLDAAEQEKIDEAKKQAEHSLSLIQASKKSLEHEDKELSRKEKAARESLAVAQELLRDATSRLVNAKGDPASIGVATVLIQGSQEKVDEVTNHLSQLDKERKSLRKRKTELLDKCEVQLKKKK